MVSEDIPLLTEMSDEEIKNVKLIVFDVDGVIIPTGTDLKENDDGTEFWMKTHKLSDNFIKNIIELKKYVRVAFSSGRNFLYLRSLVKDFFDESIIVQSENAAITFIDSKMSHPVYPKGYFETMFKLKNLILKNKKALKLEGFEPKIFNFAVHTEEEVDLIYELVKSVDNDGMLYCIWTGEAYDIGLKGITKGWGVAEIAKKMNITPNQIITTGNALNDKEMLEFGIGVTMRPDRVSGKYKCSGGDGLGGEELAEFLVKKFRELRN